MSSAKPYPPRVYFLYWKWIQEFSRGTENLLENSGKLSAEYHRFLPAGCKTYRRNPLLCIMWRGAVNRQPGYRARNLQRWNKKPRTQRKQRKSRPKSENQENHMESKRNATGRQKNMEFQWEIVPRTQVKQTSITKKQNIANKTTETARNPPEKDTN